MVVEEEMRDLGLPEHHPVHQGQRSPLLREDGHPLMQIHFASEKGSEEEEMNNQWYNHVIPTGAGPLFPYFFVVMSAAGTTCGRVASYLRQVIIVSGVWNVEDI